MKVSSTSSPLILAQPNGNSSSPPPGGPQPEQPKDSFLQAVGKESARTAVSYSNAFNLVGGKVGGALLVVPGLYAGALGGAALGAFIGGGLGPMVAAVTSHGGAVDFIGSSLGTVGAAAKALMFVGAAAGGVGAFKAGEKIVGGLARVPGLVTGGVAGAGQGAWNSITHVQGESQHNSGPAKPGDEPDQGIDFSNMSAPIKVFGGLASAAGAISGAAGGAAIGAGVMSAGNLLSGLMVKDFTWSALGQAATTGAIGGAVILGLCGAYGGWKLVEMGQAAIRKGIHKYHQGQQWLELDKKENLLKDMETRLNNSQSDILKAHEAALTNHKVRAKNLDDRQGAVGDKEGQVAFKNANEPKLEGERADGLYKTEKGRLVQSEAGLNGEKVRLDSEKERIDAKEAKVPQLSEERATKMYNNRQAELQSIYTTRQDQLDGKERDVKNKENNIPNTVNTKVQAELQPLRDDIRRTQENANNLDSQARQLNNQASTMQSQIPGVEQQTRNTQSQEQQITNEANGKQPTLTNLQGQVDTSRQDLNRKHNDNANLQSELDTCLANHKKS